MVKAETEQLINRYTKVARIPGFRKGKVPAGVIRQRFAEDIKSEIVEQLVPRYFREEVQEAGTARRCRSRGLPISICTKASR